MTKVPAPRKLNALDIAIYGIMIAVLLVICGVVGAAMDYSIGADGKPDLTRISSGLEYVTSNPKLLAQCFHNKQSYAIKMMLFGAMGIGIFLLYKYSEGNKRLHRKGVEHGSAKFGDEKEKRSMADTTKPEFKPLLTADGKRVFDKKGNFAGVYIDNNIILSKNVKMSLDTHKHGLNLNCLVEGGSGTGKTRTIVEPNIMQLNTSYVITDPKGEILQHTGKLLTEAGYVVRVLNLIEMEHSNNYNPFNYVYDKNGKLGEGEIQKMINALFTATKGDGEKEDFWSQKGKTMLNAIILLLFEESAYHAKFDEKGEIIESTRDRTHLNFYAVTEKMRRLQYPPRGSQIPDGFFLERGANEDEAAFRKRQTEAFLCPLDKDFIELEKRKPEGCIALDLYKEVRNAPEETGQSFLSSANVKTFMFNLSGIKNLTCCDNIELEKLGDRKTALFLIISATDGTYNFLANIMYTQMFDTLSNRANMKYHGSLPIHVRCIMDEFANIGEIPEFEKIIAYVRSMGMSCTVIIQSLSQLKARYEKTYETIIDCCSTTIFLGGRGQSTLKELSETLGKETIDVRGQNRTKGKQSSTSENNSIMGRELMTEGELASMPRESCVVMCQYHNPFLDDKYELEKHPNYKYLSHYDKKNAYSIDSIRSVTVEELMRKQACATYSTNTPLPEEQTEKIVTVFKSESSPTEIYYDTYEEAALYGTDYDDAISEEYTDESPMYGMASSYESIELGEPIRETRKEVMVDEREPDQIPVAIEIESEETIAEEESSKDSDTDSFYGYPEEEVQQIVDPDISEACVETEEIYANLENYEDAGYSLHNEDDYGKDWNEDPLFTL